MLMLGLISHCQIVYLTHNSTVITWQLNLWPSLILMATINKKHSSRTWNDLGGASATALSLWEDVFTCFYHEGHWLRIRLRSTVSVIAVRIYSLRDTSMARTSSFLSVFNTPNSLVLPNVHKVLLSPSLQFPLLSQHTEPWFLSLPIAWNYLTLSKE